MQKRQYYNKCKNLFEKASQKGVELEFDPEQFDANRLNCTWIGGWYAYITLTPELDIEIGAIGDVCATLLDKNGEEIICVKDKNNTGAFAECMGEYIKSDDHLKELKQENRLIFENNNWIEYDGIYYPYGRENPGIMVDLGIINDNILDDNILEAIDQVLKGIPEITKEISDYLLVIRKEEG